PRVPAGVDAVGRELDLGRNSDVGRGKAQDLAAPAVALLDDASHLMGATEQTVGSAQVACLEGSADRGGRNGALEAGHGDERQPLDFEAQVRPHAPQEFDVPTAVAPEVEGLT